MPGTISSLRSVVANWSGDGQRIQGDRGAGHDVVGQVAHGIHDVLGVSRAVKYRREVHAVAKCSARPTEELAKLFEDGKARHAALSYTVADVYELRHSKRY